MPWEDFRREDDSINLKEAFNDFYMLNEASKQLDSTKLRYSYLERIENLQLIKSRQVAANIIAMAGNI